MFSFITVIEKEIKHEFSQGKKNKETNLIPSWREAKAAWRREATTSLIVNHLSFLKVPSIQICNPSGVFKCAQPVHCNKGNE